MEFLKKIKTNKKLQDNKGFTLIEVLISLAMIAILTGATLQIVRFSDTQKSLIIERDKFRSAIREAQSYSLSIPNTNSDHICGFGVYVENESSYKLFYTYANEADWDVPAEACNNCLKYDVGVGCSSGIIGAAVDLADEISFTTGTGTDIFFKAPYGDVYQAGSGISGDAEFEITHGARQLVVSVNEFGKVE